jgi:ubiquinol-cytochrome c reductase iron-sulfur subunit
MAPLATASRLCLRSAAVAKPAVRALSSSAVRQSDAPAPGAASYTSPFKGESKGAKIPDFSKYMSKGNETTNKLFSYFMVGTMGAITAAGAKSTVQGGLMWMAFCFVCGMWGNWEENELGLGIENLEELE